MTLQYENIERSLPTTPASRPDIHPKFIRTLAILDDDPTGTQTVHDITVLTTSDQELIEHQLRKREPGFFILTNSRALPPDQASSLLCTILTNLREASKAVEIHVDVVLRSDSTLRGHFPLEAQLAHSILGPFSAWVLAPAFFEGGRVTVKDIHYVREGDLLTPVAETPFAQDRSFGFTSSNLGEWVRGKYGLKETPEIISIGISELRHPDGPKRIAALLDAVSASGTQPQLIILNGFCPSDYETFVAGESLVQTGSARLYRTGASFISARLGISPIPPIAGTQLFHNNPTKAGGLVVAGSYVPKTTAQLEALLGRCAGYLSYVELEVDGLLVANEETKMQIVQHAVRQVEETLNQGNDCLISTSRKLIFDTTDASASLSIGNTVSDVLVKIVRAVNVRPRYVIAKGGITSSDIATKAMGMKLARVVGQAAIGVPLWRSQNLESKWSDIPYVVFPGNVGHRELLGELVASYRL